ncbi:ogr/Delta-like zinc finger family protein [Paracidovorax valerianellae]|uniref:ogr/Delta-like zinc finger family protein n=1 Tax=Paracidovorax valerianellae TaxID=187868 RepID=UPI0023037D97|nr:ogr/Delta-like zinc finger family protein [Paracidovorax valerianellae]MDA8444783.1 ogr/Delta-like zinc finger family protein [Paracidovorax valerianellae]
MMQTAAERQALHAAKPARARTSHQGKKLRYEGTRRPCPMCEAQAEIRTSQQVTKTLFETYYQCTNVECGATFVVAAEIARMLNLGATPNPAVNIPLSTHVRRNLVRVMLENALLAEHQARYTTPVTGDLFADAPPAPNTT